MYPTPLPVIGASAQGSAFDTFCQTIGNLELQRNSSESPVLRFHQPMTLFGSAWTRADICRLPVVTRAVENSIDTITNGAAHAMMPSSTAWSPSQRRCHGCG